MSTPSTEFKVPLVYSAPGASYESVEHETLAKLEQNKQLYEWERNDGYPPHLSKIPEAVDKSGLQIFNVEAFFQTGGMLLEKEKLSSQYFRLAPDPKAPKSFKTLVEHNQSQRAPGGVNDNMLFRFNIGDRKYLDWFSDAVFAQQHFTGTNATTITLAEQWISAFEERAEALGEAKALEFLRTQPKTSFYVQDYTYFRGAMGYNPTDEIGTGKGQYGCAPVALFHLGDDAHLYPLAIVVDYKGSMAASVVIFNKRLPPGGTLAEEENDWPWRYAKTCVQSADWLRHEVSIHLVNTHLVEEASIVSAHRTLPPEHVVFKLLEKHWETTLPLNREARNVLIPKVITELAGVGKAELGKFLNHAYESFDWKRLRIPEDLEARGFPLASVEDSLKYRNYAYARNMALMWPAIRAFVASVLRPYYPGGDNHVAQDPYLKAFCDEMRSPQGANMQTFPEIKTLDELIETVTMCIHIASPQHTAVNYLQHYYQVFVPNKPWALYTPLPSSLKELQQYKEQHLLDALPFHNTQHWLIGAQLPYLLSFEVIGTSSLLTYAQTQSQNPVKVFADSAKVFAEELKRLQQVFKKHSKDLTDQHTKYMVMDPGMTAVSILI